MNQVSDDALRARATHASHGARSGLRHSVGIAIAALALSGCDDPNSNGALRVQLFERCMKMLPEGPRATRYNDWDEVVGACDSAAVFQARMCGENAKACAEVAQGMETREGGDGTAPSRSDDSPVGNADAP